MLKSLAKYEVTKPGFGCQEEGGISRPHILPLAIVLMCFMLPVPSLEEAGPRGNNAIALSSDDGKSFDNIPVAVAPAFDQKITRIMLDRRDTLMPVQEK